jgi:hypothetical protein
MTPPMDSPRTTISLGPIELSIRRNDEGLRFGLPGSIVVHVLIVVLAVLISGHVSPTKQAEAMKATSPPIPITFVSPIPPPPAPKVPPQPQSFDARKPPPRPVPKPLRMEHVPEITAAAPNKTNDKAKQSSGQHDTKPAGGEAGGPLPRPTSGAPEAQNAPQAASPLDEPKDLQGRLQDFRHALETPQPPKPKGPKGGGTGLGGVNMPRLPETGYGIGNLEFEGRDYDWDDYGRQIYWRIWSEWHKQLLNSASLFERWASEHRIWLLAHQNRIRFTILRSGQIVDVAVETQSGCYPLDDSATNALKAVVLPPLPEDFTRESETIHATFKAEGEIRGMGSYLQQMREYCTCF